MSYPVTSHRPVSAPGKWTRRGMGADQTEQEAGETLTLVVLRP